MYANRQMPTNGPGSAQNLRLKPGLFSNQNTLTNKYSQDKYSRSKSPYPPENQFLNDLNNNNSFEGNGRVNTHSTNDHNDVYSSILDPLSGDFETDQIRHSEQPGRSYKQQPLGERNQNNPLFQRRDSRSRNSQGNRVNSSEKQPLRKSIGPSGPVPSQYDHQTSQKKLPGYMNPIRNTNSEKKYSQRNPVSRNNVLAAQNYIENNENIDVNIYQGASQNQASIRTRSTEKKRPSIGENNFPILTRDQYQPTGPSPNKTSHQLHGAIADVERLRKENNNLGMALQNLNQELAEERSRCTQLENETATMSNNISEERSKYQTELVKISQQIKKLRNIQSLYVNEKKHSEDLEGQLNVKQKSVDELTAFVHNFLNSGVSILELLLIKGDTYLEKQVQNQDFSFESYMKLLYEVRKVLISNIETSESLTPSQDWSTPEGRQVIISSKDIMKLRKNANFKLYVDKNAYNSTDRKTSSTHYNSKQISTSRSVTNLNSNQSQPASASGLSLSNNTHFNNNSSPSDFGTKRDNKDVQINLYQSNPQTTPQQGPDFVPFNSRIQLLENYTHTQREEFEFHNIKEETETEENPDSFRKKDISPAKFSDEKGVHSLGSTILPRNNVSGFNETFDNILADRNHGPNSDGFGSAISNKNYDIPPTGNFSGVGVPSSSQFRYNEPETNKNKFNKKKLELDPKNFGALDPNDDIFHQGITEYSNESHSQSSVLCDTKPINKEEFAPYSESKREKVPYPDRVIPHLKLNQEKGTHNQDSIVENYFSDGALSEASIKVHDTQQNAMKRTNTGGNMSSNRTNSPMRMMSQRRSGQKDTDSVIELNCVDSNTHRNNDAEERSEVHSDITMNQFAVAKFDYNAQKENDLNFKKGDKIQVLKMTDSGWWIGLCNTKIGYFPFNYVSIAD